MYQLLKRSDQNAICNIIRKTSNNNKHFKITPHRILRAFHVLVWAKNICAHDDRFYCAKRTNDNFGTVLFMLEMILGKQAINKFRHSTRLLIRKYIHDIKIFTEEELKSILGLS